MSYLSFRRKTSTAWHKSQNKFNGLFPKMAKNNLLFCKITAKLTRFVFSAVAWIIRYFDRKKNVDFCLTFLLDEKLPQHDTKLGTNCFRKWQILICLENLQNHLLVGAEYWITEMTSTLGRSITRTEIHENWEPGAFYAQWPISTKTIQKLKNYVILST